MKLRWFMPIAVLIPLQIKRRRTPWSWRVSPPSLSILARMTVLHLRPEFESTIRMPEEITSVILGSPGEFKAEHSEENRSTSTSNPSPKSPHSRICSLRRNRVSM